MQQYIQNAIVNAIEDTGNGHLRSTSGVDDVIDKVSENLAATLYSAVEAFLDSVEQRDESLVEGARDLFVQVGLAEREVVAPVVDHRDEEVSKVKTEIAEWMAKVNEALARL